MTDVTTRNEPKPVSVQARQRAFRDILQRADQTLLQHLHAMLEKADELFFDLSNRATSNTEQNCYFEAMREIREKSADAVAGFRAARQQLLQRAESAATPDKPAEGTGSRTLELLQPEELEQNVAIAGMVSKARAGNAQRLPLLGYRLGWLLHTPLDERSNPLDPQQVCHAFTQACQPLRLHIKARLVLLKQFDQQVLQALPDILTQVEHDLQQLGYVPEAPPPGQPDAAALRARRRAGQHDFNALSELLGGLRALGISIPSAPRISQVNDGPALAASELMAGITRLQSLYTHKPQGGAREIRAVIQQLLAERQRNGQPSSLAPMDEDVINLVALFFDFVLDDDALPTCIKLLISRLQLQVLKAALRDPGFFSDADHPARAFIECVASAGMGCSDSDPHDALFQALQASVQAILDDPQGSDQVFSRQADRISDIVAHEQRKSALIEKRTSESAQGQARARHARSLVQGSLYQMLRDRYLPDAVFSFLVTTWRDVMFQVYLKFGQQSPEWEESMAVVSDLIRASAEGRRPADGSQLPALAGSLLPRITRLSDKAATPTAITAVTFRNLEAVCRQWLSGDAARIPLAPMTPLHAEALGQSLANAMGSWDEEIAQQREERKYASLSFDALRQADQLEPGAWLFRQNPLQPEQGQRCKLAAKIAETDSCIFVDANGFRLFEMPRRSVAYELQRGRLRILDDGPLFERAFGTITQNIQDLTGEITSGH